MYDTFKMNPEAVKDIATSISDKKRLLEGRLDDLNNSLSNLQSNWYGDLSSKEAYNRLTEIINIYRELIDTVDSTSKSLDSSAQALVDTDKRNAATF